MKVEFAQKAIIQSQLQFTYNVWFEFLSIRLFILFLPVPILPVWLKIGHLKDTRRCQKVPQMTKNNLVIFIFQVTQSGLVPALLTYLTKTSGTGTDPDEIPRETRLRTFLHVFLGCPKMTSQSSLNENSGTFLQLANRELLKLLMFLLCNLRIQF